ncbi:hypothetical protein B4U80_14969, partial [Leptotrombidium deliense]
MSLIICFLSCLLIIFAVENSTGKTNQNEQYCKSAQIIAKSVNESVNPCDNFYRFSCDKWKSKHTIAVDRSRVNLFTMVADAMQTQIIKVLNSTLVKGEATAKLRTLYDECMDI